MRKSFSAILIKDVSYCDLEGHMIVQPAGTLVTVTKLVDELFYSCQNVDQWEVCPEGYIASIGMVHFDITSSQFQVFN